MAARISQLLGVGTNSSSIGEQRRIFQPNPWQPFDVAHTLMELERRLGSEWHFRFTNSRDKRIDYVLIYDGRNDNEQHKEIRERFEERLRKDNLEVERWRKSDCWTVNDGETDDVFVMISTPFDRLALECQSVKFDMPLNGQTNPQSKSCCQLNCLKLETDDEVDYITAPFSLTRLSIYKGSDDLRDFFQPAIASYLTHHILINTDIQEEDKIQRGTTTKGLSYLLHTCIYSEAFILHPYSPKDPINTPATQVINHACDISLELDSRVSRRFVMRERQDVRQELADTWCRWFKFQPLCKIRNYFGEKLAFYFAWLGLLISSLIIPSFLGSGVFLFGLAHTYSSNHRNITAYYDWMIECFDNGATPVFSLIVCVWGTLFLELWKRKQVRLQYEWDVHNFNENEPDRPQFYGRTVKDPVTELNVVMYPLSHRLSKMAGSLMVVVSMVLLVLASLVAIIVYRLVFEHDWLKEENIKRVPGEQFLPTLSASILNALSILVLKQVYNKLAKKLTDWENHRTQSAYENGLIVKLFAFHFVNSYASLFYIAFFRNTEFEDGFAGMGNKYRDSCGDNNDCMTMLTVQVAVLMFMQPLPKFLIDYIWPWIKKSWRFCYNRRCKNKVGVEPALTCSEDMQCIDHKRLVTLLIEQQRQIEKMDDFHFTEYSEKVIMYGYLMIFAAAFPLAPLIAFLTNLIDLWLDAKHLVWHTRRPVAEIACNIGIWQNILVFINIVAVVSNGFLIAFTSEFGHEIRDEYGQDGRLWLLVVFEHVVFFFMFLVSFCIPDVPKDVKNAKKREKVVIDQIMQDSTIELFRNEQKFTVKKHHPHQTSALSSLTSVKTNDMMPTVAGYKPPKDYNSAL